MWQRDELQEAFVESISKSAVAALASRYNGNKECVVDDELRNGSYNVCVFVTFPADGTRWVVRIPMTPLVADGWTKLKSEVATMRYLQQNTTIPIPKIHAYGKGEFLTTDKRTTQEFLIMDLVPGKTLDLDILCASAQDIQDRFFAEFVGILAQLHDLEFPHTGSLYPDPDSADEERYIIGPSLYLLENDMEVEAGIRREVAPALRTTREVIKYLHAMLECHVDIPDFQLVRPNSREMVFAQAKFAELLPRYCDSSPDSQPLALSHADLRCGNILVDDDFRIQGVIDWEWVTILPRQFCIPPLWICGLDTDMRDNTRTFSRRFVSRDKIFEAFQRAASSDDKYKEYNKYLTFWKEDQFCLPMSFILRSPHFLLYMYFGHIYDAMYEQSFEKEAATFFASEDMRKKLEHRQETSRRYVDYLQQEGLYKIEEKHLRMRSHLEKMEKYFAETEALLAR
ncbi:hypothetical protein E4U54_001126 [Claviceps lovelessii]|nr:hypothetical protein E4U54_001126 [Claviceps lovelessii]